jgi:hypothetical protein
MQRPKRKGGAGRAQKAPEWGTPTPSHQLTYKTPAANVQPCGSTGKGRRAEGGWAHMRQQRERERAAMVVLPASAACLRCISRACVRFAYDSSRRAHLSAISAVLCHVPERTHHTKRGKERRTRTSMHPHRGRDDQTGAPAHTIADRALAGAINVCLCKCVCVSVCVCVCVKGSSAAAETKVNAVCASLAVCLCRCILGRRTDLPTRWAVLCLLLGGGQLGGQGVPLSRTLCLWRTLCLFQRHNQRLHRRQVAREVAAIILSSTPSDSECVCA